jgi:adenylate cyclase
LPAGTFTGRKHRHSPVGQLWRQPAGVPAGGRFRRAFQSPGRSDFDGISRRVPLLVEYKGQYYESLVAGYGSQPAWQSDRWTPGYPEKTPGKSYAAMEWLDLKTTARWTRCAFRSTTNAATLIPYRGYQGSFPYILNYRCPQ